MKLSFKLSALSLFLSLFISSQAMAKKAAIIQGYDVIALPGEEISLEVKVERARFFPLRLDLRGQKIHFSLNGMHLGASSSKNDGLAKLKAVFYESGVKVVKAVLDEGSKYSAGETDCRVLVLDSNMPLMVTDIDHTISDISSREFIRTLDVNIPALPGASESVNRLNKQLNVIYITARDDAFIKRTKFWLDLKKFPVAPSFFWDFGPFNEIPHNHGKYKELVIRELKEKHRNILIGVGDKPHDVMAYRANGLRAYYIGLSGFELPKHTIVVKSWKEVETHLEQNPMGSLEGDPVL